VSNDAAVAAADVKLSRMQDSFVGQTLTMWSHLLGRFRGRENETRCAPILQAAPKLKFAGIIPDLWLKMLLATNESSESCTCFSLCITTES
jgi:hypothetical protein